MSCKRVARAAIDASLASTDASVEVFVVWTRMLAGDDTPAVVAMAALDADPRVHVFDDTDSLAAHALAELAGMPRMDSVCERWGKSEAELAALFHPRFLEGPATLFDTALVFGESRQWSGDRPPTPEGFVTQLAPDMFEGIPAERYRAGPAFGEELRALVEAAGRAER